MKHQHEVYDPTAWYPKDTVPDPPGTNYGPGLQLNTRRSIRLGDYNVEVTVGGNNQS